MDEGDVRTRKLKRVEYDRLVEAEVFGPEDRIELFDGRMIFKEPQYSPHATAVALVQRVLTAARHVLPRYSWHDCAATVLRAIENAGRS